MPPQGAATATEDKGLAIDEGGRVVQPNEEKTHKKTDRGAITMTSLDGWSTLPSDWFGLVARYLTKKEFYRNTIAVCRVWKSHSARIPLLNFSVKLDFDQEFLMSLIGISSQFRHVRILKNGSPRIDRYGRHSGRPAQFDRLTFGILSFHFPSLTALECSLDIDEVSEQNFKTFPSLRSSRISLTMSKKDLCLCGSCVEITEANHDGGSGYIHWSKVETIVSSLISPHQTHFYLSLNFWEGHLDPLHYLWAFDRLPWHNLKAFTLKLCTMYDQYGYRQGESTGDWIRLVNKLRSCTSLTQLNLPRMNLPILRALLAHQVGRPFHWRHLTRLTLLTGGPTLQQLLLRSQRQYGWPRLLPEFYCSHYSNPSQYDLIESNPINESIDENLAQYDDDLDDSNRTDYRIKFLDGWHQVDPKLVETPTVKYAMLADDFDDTTAPDDFTDQDKAGDDAASVTSTTDGGDKLLPDDFDIDDPNGLSLVGEVEKKDDLDRNEEHQQRAQCFSSPPLLGVPHHPNSTAQDEE